MAIPRTTIAPETEALKPKGPKKKVWRDKHWKWVPDGKGGWRKKGFVKTHRNKPKRNHKRGPGPKPKKKSPIKNPVVPTPAPTTPAPGTFAGAFGPEQATRLLNRAGFGPTPGQAQQVASMGLEAAVYSLTRPSGAAQLVGPAAVDDDGLPLAPEDAWGHDHLFWIDRMVRSNQPLVERMALNFHDWFATSKDSVSLQKQMLDQTNLFRIACFGSFLDLFRAVTIDPAMLQWLNGNENTKRDPNENYAREMMELFSLGADRGAYTEPDIREAARALTGWRNDWSDELGAHNFRFDTNRHDANNKTIFGRTGRWNWSDACLLCVENPLHASFFVDKLWSYFIPTPPSDAKRSSLISLYTGGGYQMRPVIEQILLSSEFYESGPMVKPPVVYLASMLRRVGRYLDTEAWTWLMEQAGQRLYFPPNVAGWDDTRWLDTSRMRARWNTVTYVLEGTSVDPWNGTYSRTETPEEGVFRAVGEWGSPTLAPEHTAELLDLARRSQTLAVANWQQGPYRALRQNALLQLIGVSPDMNLQ